MPLFRVVRDVTLADLENALNALTQDGFDIWELILQTKTNTQTSGSQTVERMQSVLVIGIRHAVDIHPEDVEEDD